LKAATAMATCPLCLYANPASSSVCTRCGKFRFPNGVPEAYDSVPTSEMRTRIVAEIESEIGADESARRTIRGPMTVPQSNPKSKSAIRSALSTVKATLISDSSDAYSVVPVETPPPVAPAPPRLVVIRGEKPNVEFPIYDGKNYVGRASDKPVDIDLTGQESPDQVWSSRQHALVTHDRGTLFVEDLNSLNGTFVNRSRLHPGQKRVLQSGDVVQIGTVQFRVEI
jgi:pSer/pThr/pTyr-binding forkhead associated (FHA) protein